ncbi:O-antigen ligase family protein [Aureisphaera galaxeae]|uniref:O-antigen ligase family protein n=1 Tax=Aureisphaera galaxeae TaxID=1538023 RepID=UPI00234FC3AC|nr:O-antigen ligase family protein [Aureisphaera galaxeae]MDC8006310.1 O-antigen ligase family protein [Aureisphaera galaxeae]
MAVKGIKKITYLQLLALHALFAFVVYFFGFAAKFLLIAIVLYFLVKILSTNNRNDEVLIAAAYMTGIEVFARMTGGAISYEFSKYSVTGFLVIGMFYRGFNRNSWPYVIYLVFLVPGILFSAINLNYDTSIVKALAGNLTGPICVGISALYCYNRKISTERLQHILLAVLFPVVTTTLYLYLYTPSVQDVVTGTQSNFATSGGFGPNQVATILGLGMFILFARLLQYRNLLLNLVDVGILGLMSYRAIVTFSRGGVLTAALCAAAFLAIYYWYSRGSTRVVLVPKIGVIVVALLLAWGYSSISTRGLIDKRYANQDAAGREKQDLTTGRIDLLNSELEAFYSNPFTGIGVGKIKEYRLETTGRESATHNEVSRILSEHGMFGLLALSILLFKPLMRRFRDRSNLFLYSFVIFWFLTINHSSMRLVAPAFIYGLALLTIISEKKKNTIRRQQLTG